MSDDHAFQAVSAYGHGLNYTPNIDRIAKEGALFNKGFVTNSICAPSRAVMLTGKHSFINGKVDNIQDFNWEQPNFAKDLQGAGYQTAMVGKIHLRGLPQGFDYSAVLPGQGHYYNPDFIINADIGDRRRFFEGSHLTINAELNKEAFVSVLGWYPDIDKENYYKLFPNEFDKNNFLQNRFKIPTRSNSTRYKLDIGFPSDLKKDETQEFIIVLATKRKFAILNKIKASELLTRLDDEGKSNWYMQKIGYSVLRKK